MGFDEGRMVLDSPNGAYYSGQTVRGNLIFQQDRTKTFRGLYVKFIGFCKVHWTTTETRRVNDRDETYTKVHESYEEYINVKIYLVGGESGEHHIQPGHHDYPFAFQIPGSCPSSFEGQYGHIRYEIKAIVDRAFKFDQEKKVAVRVLAPLDLNQNPYCREPVEMEISNTYCCCCFSSGSTDTSINAPMSGYCPGQKIPIEITTANNGTVEITHIKLRLKKKIVFTAEHHPDSRTIKDIVAEIKKGPIPGNTTRNWTIEMEVPALDVYNLSGCRYITLTYKLEVVISPEGCHNDTEDSRQIIIGTVPLVGFQDNVVNPLQDQMPQQIAAVTQQPLPSYAVSSPYSDNNAYPTNSPYPNNPIQNPPYPVTPPHINSNPPYPTKEFFKSPYGSDNTSYPQSNSPYPPNDASKSPYPATNSPYPVGMSSAVTNSPYPVGMSSAVTNSPYPVGMSSAVTNSPYPMNDASKSPYPVSNSPFSVGISNTVTNLPYPTNAPTSPYQAQNSPYPVGTQSSGANPPYPINNSPYPDNPPPYPGNNSPYPASQQNTANQMGPAPGTGNVFGGSLLKTGNVGFVVQGSSNVGNMPFPGTARPVSISPAPVNPYSAASAPAFDSPDIEKK